MKKLMTITLALCVVIAALACGSNDPEIDGTTSATAQQGDEGEGSAKGKMLVIYFSRVDENWQVGVVEKGYTQLKADRSMPLMANPLAARKTITFNARPWGACRSATIGDACQSKKARTTKNI